MKKFLFSIVAALLASPCAFAQTYTAQSGVSLLTGVTASATHTSGAVRLPSFSGSGTLNVTETGITGSPSGCTVTLAYQQNNASTASAVVSTTAFTPSTGVQSFSVTPSVLTGDSYVAVYACSSTYPTAGTLNISFSPSNAVSTDPCFTSPKSNAVINAGAATVQLVALSAGKKIYICGATVVPTGSFSFEYGTGSLCGTGTTALTGTMVPTSGSTVTLTADGTDFTAPAGNAVCLVSATTAEGVISYVQQ